VTIYRQVLDDIVAHARAALPAECCGLLLGRGDRISEASRAPNLSADTNRFLIDPKAHIDIRREARRRDLEVLGFYHSHPHSPAQPSTADLAETSYREQVHLIVSLQTEPPAVRLFRIEENTCREVPLATA
jgi:proteasome lid subunit RPN8/RPN11